MLNCWSLLLKFSGAIIEYIVLCEVAALFVHVATFEILKKKSSKLESQYF